MDIPSKINNQLTRETLVRWNDGTTRFTWSPLDLENLISVDFVSRGYFKENTSKITSQLFVLSPKFYSLTNRQKVREEGSEERL